MSEEQNLTNLTPKAAKVEAWQRRFLEELAQSGVVWKACQAARRSRDTVYERRQLDPEFARQWETAKEDAGDVLESEAIRRGVEGVEKPIYQGGTLVGTVREYSDGLLTLLLKAAKPEKYREKTDQRHSGPDGGPIQVHQTIDAAALTDEQLDLLEQILSPPAEPGGSPRRQAEAQFPPVRNGR